MLLNILIGKVGVDPQLRGLADFPKVPGLSPSTLGRAATPVLGDLMLSSGLREHHRKSTQKYIQPNRQTPRDCKGKVCECKMHNSIRLAQPKGRLRAPQTIANTITMATIVTVCEKDTQLISPSVYWDTSK